MTESAKPGLIGQIKDKLIRSKERTYEEGRRLTRNRAFRGKTNGQIYRN